jgi:hypothetical protein
MKKTALLILMLVSAPLPVATASADPDHNFPPEPGVWATATKSYSDWVRENRPEMREVAFTVTRAHGYSVTITHLRLETDRYSPEHHRYFRGMVPFTIHAQHSTECQTVIWPRKNEDTRSPTEACATMVFRNHRIARVQITIEDETYTAHSMFQHHGSDR